VLLKNTPLQITVCQLLTHQHLRASIITTCGWLQAPVITTTTIFNFYNNNTTPQRGNVIAFRNTMITE